jgi:2'-5' RNA ligase
VRCFLALDLTAAAQDQLGAEIEHLRGLGDFRFVPVRQLHLTLRFLGEIDGRQQRSFAALVATGAWPLLRLGLHGLGQFPPRGAPRVLWAGVAGDLDALAAIAGRCEAAAVAAGLPPEDRPYHPHVTLGRARSPRGAARLSAALRERSSAVAGGSFVPPGVVLYRSELRPEGSVHTALERRALDGG